jgi:hypothetical protein
MSCTTSCATQAIVKFYSQAIHYKLHYKHLFLYTTSIFASNKIIILLNLKKVKQNKIICLNFYILYDIMSVYVIFIRKIIIHTIAEVEYVK